jgi:hypothetical protein
VLLLDTSFLVEFEDELASERQAQRQRCLQRGENCRRRSVS